MLRETARSQANQWGQNRQPAWSEDEAERVCNELLELSAVVTPHIVEDVPLSDEERERLRLSRVENALAAWLVRAAASLRRPLRMGPPRRTADGKVRVGLRSASDAELVAIPGVGRRRAEEISRLVALSPQLNSIDDLAVLDNVGPETIRELQAHAYLDAPVVGLASPTLLDFCRSPSVTTFLAVLDASDLELTYGDESSWARRKLGGGSTVDRFLRFARSVRTDAERRLSPRSGVLASQGRRYLERQAKRASYMSGLVPSNGALIVDQAYVNAAVEIVGSASTAVRLAIFLATAPTTGEPESHSMAVIQALEARAAAGVSVRVILDRDEPDAPYLSRVINSAVARRLRDAGVEVKRDEPAVLLHSKFLVADEASVLVGSHNLTRASMSATHEVSVRIDNATVAKSFADRFDALWSSLPDLT